MRPKAYPLDPLVGLRKAEVDAKAQALSSAIRAREDAELAHRRTEAERARHAEVARRVCEEESGALDLGKLTASDLQRQHAWQARTQWEAEERQQRVATAIGREAAARNHERQAMSSVATAEANAKVVTEHRARWTAARDRAADAAAEEGAAEAWRPRR
jgi:hypothetical protein